MKAELVSKGIYVHVGGDMVWPNPNSERIAEIEWKMRHKKDSVTQNDLMIAASVIDAYRDIMTRKTQSRRNAVCSAIKQANDQ